MKALHKLKSWLTLGPPAEGIYFSHASALHVEASKARLVRADGSNHTVSMSMDSAAAGSIVVAVDSTVGGRDLSVSRVFSIAEADDAKRFYVGHVKSFFRLNRVSESRGSPWLWALGGAAALMVAGQLLAVPAPVGAPSQALGSTTFGGPAAGTPAGTAAAQDSVKAAQQLLEQLAAAGPGKAMATSALPARLTPEEMTRVAKATSIEIVKGEVMLAAFSDPLCPACRELDAEAGKFAGGQGFKVFPVAFQDGSRELTAAILCSKDPKAAWLAAIKGQRPSELACEAGLKQIDANIELFADIGATSTPTLVAPNGTVAAGSSDAKTLAVFTGMNTK